MLQSYSFGRKTIAILSILFILFIAFVYFFVYGKSSKGISLSLPNASSPLPLEKKKQIASETTRYILSQRRGDNYYTYMSHYDDLCAQKNGTKVCPFNSQNVYETTNAWTSLSHLASYQLTHDASSLEQAKEDMKLLTEWCMDKKDKCRWVLVQAVRLYEVTRDPQLLSFLDAMAEHMVTVRQNEELEPMLTSIEVRELAMIYGLTKKPQYLEDAKSKLKMAYTQLQNQDKDIYIRHPFPYSTHSCWYFLAENEIGKVDKNKYYTDRVKTFLDQGDIYKNYKSFAHPVEIQPCIELMYLYGSDYGQKYRDQSVPLLKIFINDFWDGKDNKKYYGEGGTIANARPELVKFDYKYVTMTDTAYTNYLLALVQ